MALTNLTGAVAVITGGGSGIGQATAKNVHAKGAHVVLADLNREGMQKTEALLRHANPTATGDILSVPTDVTSEEQVCALMQRAVDTFGHIDLVVASAGIGRGGPIDLFTAGEMQAMMNVNFMGIYHCVQAALPSMRQQGAGYFVFLSSVAGKLGSPFLSGYCATKWAVRGFASALRVELHGTGIGITTVYPAWVDTPMIQQEEATASFMHIEALLTADQVAAEIVQAVAEERRDLTLAPNPDIALALQLYASDPDQAEMLMGESFRKQLESVQS